jgi:hypothetical protein
MAGNGATLTDRIDTFAGLPSAMHVGEGMEVKDPENAQEP